MPDNSVDLVFTSPPYEDARDYGIGFAYRGQRWVDWAVRRYVECVRVSRGLVAWVVEGRTRSFRWSATPALLMADLHRAGVCLRKPPVYKRHGTFGGGGREWLRNDYEFIVCSSKGKLPWADNTAMGHAPKYPPGGNPSHRKADGTRVKGRAYKPPERVNPGNVIDCGAAGGGNIGSLLAHENEAPFPEQLAEFFVRSFCPPGGFVLDPFGGSGTTAAVALRLGRNAVSVDIRASQGVLTKKRIQEAILRESACRH